MSTPAPPSRSASANARSGLLVDVAQGKPDALRRALDAYGPLVWSIARTYCSQRHEAEDATQEAFLKLWRMADRFDPQRGTETSFVVSVARNRILEFRRSLTRREKRVSAAPAPDAAAAPDADPAMAWEESRQAQRALEQLSHEQQQAVRLVIQRGLTQEDIAQSLNIPLGTVKTRIRSALIKLRETLASGESRSPARSGAPS